MKRFIAVLGILGLLGLTPAVPAYAYWGEGRDRAEWRERAALREWAERREQEDRREREEALKRYEKRQEAEFWGSVAIGALGAILNYAHSAPAPAYAAPPAPTCSTTRGYWTRVPVTDAYGYTTYQREWVPGQTVCR